jgi:hypothetical protein
MLIFRLEHNRHVCNSSRYELDGSSPTGHGPIFRCPSALSTPNFGSRGRTPVIPMQFHERCAVTAEQFNSWISVSENQCRELTEDCIGSYNCLFCPPVNDSPLYLSYDWLLIAYEVDESQEGIGWRIDGTQVIFDPSKATLVGKVSEQFIRDRARALV